MNPVELLKAIENVGLLQQALCIIADEPGYCADMSSWDRKHVVTMRRNIGTLNEWRATAEASTPMEALRSAVQKLSDDYESAITEQRIAEHDRQCLAEHRADVAKGARRG